MWDCFLNKVFKALQNKSCLPQRKKTPDRTHVHTLIFIMFLSYFSASSHLNVRFLNEQCQSKVCDSWLMQTCSALSSPWAEICHVTLHQRGRDQTRVSATKPHSPARELLMFPLNVLYTWTTLFTVLSIFCGEIKVNVVGMLGVFMSLWSLGLICHVIKSAVVTPMSF